MVKVESFSLDHTKVKAPYVRKCGVQKGENGDNISKFDLRFMQPNKEIMPTAAIHSLEHLLAGIMREKIETIIDISPMGCRTGFYLTAWGDVEVDDVIEALDYSLKKVLEEKEVPAANELQCGNYRDHSIELAQEYAKKVLREGFSSEIYR
ncbi:MAG: S-ribosylhomocysteine lyase [Clostridium sp.]|uniref:S-ribosylhomocysteine lyase n=1 Tax=Clostridium sp. TaxID=1506 RepID=UPI0025C65C34|nr:S-ribosylhomocysteine lyase [Clostridium sp.]MCF0148835.1 S-ribosylhomocysteine lyase [Clostridium sp.]